jgi:hypothetical protein
MKKKKRQRNVDLLTPEEKKSILFEHKVYYNTCFVCGRFIINYDDNLCDECFMYYRIGRQKKER